MPQDEYMNPRAQELAGHLSLLEDIDFRVTPEHVARCFHELLDTIERWPRPWLPASSCTWR
jgi:hypothetical protein